MLTITRGRCRRDPVCDRGPAGFAAFFSVLLIFSASPFETRSPGPGGGVGPEPASAPPVMMIHPIALYSGYTLAAVPFAFAIGALIARRIDAEWIAATRRSRWRAGCASASACCWARAGPPSSWAGGATGLGPGRERRALPWLTGTAFIHSIMIQEKRGMLKIWNVSLMLATGTLAIVGTFLVRAGSSTRSTRSWAGQHDGRAVHRPDRGDVRRLDRARRLAPRSLARSTGSNRCSRARPCSWATTSCSSRYVRRLLGDVLPADLRGDHR